MLMSQTLAIQPPAFRPLALPSANPVVGIVSVIGCTVLAVMLVPMNPRPAGAMFLPALVMAIGLLGPPLALTIRCPAAAFKVDHLLMVGLTYWILLDLLQGAYDLIDVSRPAVVKGLICIGVFAAGVWSAALHRPWRVPGPLQRACRAELNSRNCLIIILVCAAVSLFRFAWPCGFDIRLMVTSLAGNRWEAPWVRGALGGWDAFIDHLPYFGYLLPTLTVLLANKRRSWSDPAVVLSMVLSLIVMIFLANSGSRRIIGVMFGSALICWVSLKGRAVKPTTLMIAGVGVGMLLLIMQMMLYYRGIGFGKVFTNDEVNSPYQHLHVDDNFFRIAQIIDLIPEQHDYTYEKTILYVLVRPIPRVLWPSKPVNAGFDLSEIVGIKQTTLSTSALGELYMSYGWLAVAIGGWVYGRLAGVFSQFLTTGTSPVRFLMFAAGAMAVFAGIRSMLDLILMSYMLLAWYGLVLILNLPSESQQPALPAPANPLGRGLARLNRS